MPFNELIGPNGLFFYKGVRVGGIKMTDNGYWEKVIMCFTEPISSVRFGQHTVMS
ncbi:MAG: hypothetical protein P8I83_03485 [Paracoccaceae bacterium]|jgi:hypothetical protein|nr:hypothetical protein [Paracoccaceae bacterium]